MEKIPEENLISRLREKKTSLYDVLEKESDENLFEYHDSSTKLAIHLKAKYSNAEEYVVYHLLIDSTPPPYADILEDFPGEDSVEKFYDDVLAKFGR